MRTSPTTRWRMVGNFYSNVTLLGASLEAVRAVSPRPALLFVDGDAVVVFAEADDEGVPRSGEALSAALGCIAVSVGVHDDDILFVEVHDSGEFVLGGAVPDPEIYFGVDAVTPGGHDPSTLEGLAPAGSPDLGGAPDAAALVAAVGRGDIGRTREAIEADFVFASERHRVLASALDLPIGAVGWGYRYLSADGKSYSGPPLVRV
jgi:hypothetical protein